MKKIYETPIAEKIEFNYADQVVASNAGDNTGGSTGMTTVSWLDFCK